MSYRARLQGQLQFFNAINRITAEAKSLPNMQERAELYQVIMWELLDKKYHNDSAKIEFYRAIEDWARANAERLAMANERA